MPNIHVVFATTSLIAFAASGNALAQSDRDRIRHLKDRVDILQQQINATADAVESAEPEQDRATIGSYGELHYNNFLNGEDSIIDFHRFVLLFGYEFTDAINFYSELELEHAVSGGEAEDENPGEVELEQAFIDFALTDTTHALGGLFLIPVGILNETHEPTTFYGVERNQVETEIIPTSWREGGGQLLGQIGATGFSYNFAVTSGFAVESDEIDIRDGRQSTAEALANDPAVTGRLKYTGIPGIELATTVQYQTDLSQEDGDGVNGAYLYEGHAQWTAGRFGLRALYARWDISGDAADALGRDQQFGYYIEPAFKITPEVGIFARYLEFEVVEDLAEENITFGANYWPIPQVVLKADYELRDTEQADGSTLDGDRFNVGVGYAF
jgi:hypothetical protein